MSVTFSEYIVRGFEREPFRDGTFCKWAGMLAMKHCVGKLCDRSRRLHTHSQAGNRGEEDK